MYELVYYRRYGQHVLDIVSHLTINPLDPRTYMFFKYMMISICYVYMIDK
jgi:hypothetical protein